MLSLTFVFNYSVLSCQGAWLYPLFSSVEVAFCPELAEYMYLGLRPGEIKYCVLDLPIRYGPVLERTLHEAILCCTFGP